VQEFVEDPGIVRNLNLVFNDVASESGNDNHTGSHILAQLEE
jgi:hypothetical protein